MVLPYAYSVRASLAGFVLAVTILVGFMIWDADDGLHLATRWTGRASALIFLPIFVARPLIDLFGPKYFAWLIRHRSGLGQALASNHHIHMVILTVYLIGEGAPASAWFHNPGLYIYGFLIAMHVTSFPSVQKKISKTFLNRLHWFGLYALASAFFGTLILSIFLGEEGGAFRWTYMLLFFTALGLRAFSFISKVRSK